MDNKLLRENIRSINDNIFYNNKYDKIRNNVTAIITPTMRNICSKILLTELSERYNEFFPILKKDKVSNRIKNDVLGVLNGF